MTTQPEITRYEWRRVTFDDCPECGCAPECWTPVEMPKNYWSDDSEVRCTECGMTGGMNADEGSVFIVWHELEEGCTCTYCLVTRHNESLLASRDERIHELEDDYIKQAATIREQRERIAALERHYAEKLEKAHALMVDQRNQKKALRASMLALAGYFDKQADEFEKFRDLYNKRGDTETSRDCSIRANLSRESAIAIRAELTKAVEK